MKIQIAIGVILTALAISAPAQNGATPSAPGKPKHQWDPEEFGIGRKHTANTRCNRAIDKLIEENRQCYNTRPAADCETLLKKNSKKMGTYIKSPRCAK
ncbi:MAG TPA: hypothetical protein VJS66_02910 [Burkholderiales bacterium]|nr:hypothetical protein [Burkholderiales bacterium]